MDLTIDAQEAMRFLAGMPAGHTTLKGKDLRSLLLHCDGMLMARGYLYNIVSRHLGAGVYRVSLEKS